MVEAQIKQKLKKRIAAEMLAGGGPTPKKKTPIPKGKISISRGLTISTSRKKVDTMLIDESGTRSRNNQ